jgi:hypothetical protein
MQAIDAPTEEQIVHAWCRMPSSVHRTTRYQATQLILRATVIAHGDIWNIKGKPVGAGVWEMWIERKVLPGDAKP